MNTNPKNRKIVLIGWDAADWKVIMPLIDQGKMPHLESLIQQGVCGNLATVQPVLSPMLWTSIATGKRAWKHGIYGFSEPDPLTGTIRPVTNLSRKTKAIWNILNQSDRKTVTVGWWPSNPAEQLSKGVMVSNDYQQAFGQDPKKWAMKPGTVHPKKLEAALAKIRTHPSSLPEAAIRPFLPALDEMNREELDKAGKDPRMQSLMKIMADCTTIHSAASLLMNAPFDLLSVYYDAIDHFGHAFMKYHPPKREHIDEWDYRLFHYCLEAGYLYHDMMLGQLMEQAGEDATVILISDHGFHPDHMRPTIIPREPAGPAIEHRKYGIFAAKGPGIRKDERIYGASLLDICPTLLHLFGLPVGEDMDGKVLLDIYEEEPDPIERIPTWDKVEGDHGMHPPDHQISPADSKAALDQLAELGYIEKPGEDQELALARTVRELDFNLAQAYADGGLYHQAIKLLEKLYSNWPDEHRFGFNLANCYQKSSQIPELRQIVEQVTQRRLDEATEAQKTLDDLQLDDEEKRKEEEEEFKKLTPKEQRQFSQERNDLVSKAYPNLFTLHYFEAFADVAERKYEEALAKLEALDQDFGARVTALLLRGEIHQRVKNWPEARKTFEEVLAIEPESSEAYIGLARNGLAERNFESARDDARRSIGLLFFQPRAHYIHAIALLRLGEWEEAYQGFQIVTTQAPLAAAAFRMLSEICSRYKNDPVAAAFYHEQVQIARKRRQEVKQFKSQTFETAEQELVEASSPGPQLIPNPEKLKDIPDDQIITVVSGLPRSGTSLMMQILEAVEIEPFTDEKRKADESNKMGYYEHEKVAGLMNSQNSNWISDAQGKAIKVVAPLLAFLPKRIPLTHQEEAEEKNRFMPMRYRVIFMERDMGEVLASQKKFLERLDDGEANRSEEQTNDVSKAYRMQVKQAKAWCRTPRVDAMTVDFGTLVTTPNDVLPQIAQFLGKENHMDKMLKTIQPDLYRSRSKS